MQAISSLNSLLQLNEGHDISADTYHDQSPQARPQGEGLRTRMG